MVLTFSLFILFGLLFGFGKGLTDYEIKTDRVAETSWNKYKKDRRLSPTKGLYGLYHKKFNLKYQERFLFSCTILVFLTDLFHFGYTLSNKIGVGGLVSIIISITLDYIMGYLPSFILGLTIPAYIIITISTIFILYQIGFHCWYTILAPKLRK